MSSFTFYANKPAEEYHRVDMWFVLSVLMLWGLGIFTLFMCSQTYAFRNFNDSFYFVKRQLICSAVGFALMAFFLFMDMKHTRALISVIVIAAFILCFLTFIPPLSIEKNGARRWLRLPLNFSFQPSELVKFAVILFLANYFDKQSEIVDEDEKTVFPCVVGLCLFVGIVIAQKDLSTGVFIFIVGLSMFFVSGSKMKWLIPVMFIAIPAVFLLITLEQYRLERIIGFFRPNEFSSTVNYQSLAAKRAISAGGFWGSGIGQGLTKINSIPEVQADYIFAGWTEAMGFLGVVLYLFLICFFAWRGYKIAFLNNSRFAAYASFGCVTAIFLQSLINCMVVCGIIPATGIPLPFFSLGGSSIIVTLGMCGFIASASRNQVETDEEVNADESKFQEISLNAFSIV